MLEIKVIWRALTHRRRSPHGRTATAVHGRSGPMYVVITAATTSIAVAATLTIKAAHSAGRVMLPVSVKVLLRWTASVAEAI